MTTLSNVSISSGYDNLEDVETEISTLRQKFLAPIDNLRSKSKPKLQSTSSQTNNSVTQNIKNDFEGLSINNLKPFESRAHAFYRMLGFPVIGGQDNFYNPGLDPNGNQTDNSRRNINTNFYKNYPELQNFLNIRESKVQEKRELFGRQDLTSSIYAILLRHSGPFQVLSENSKPLDKDIQTFTIADREVDCFILASENLDKTNEILEVGNKYKVFQKILKPFIIDPKIENTVTPDVNKICVPFLPDKKSTKIHGDVFLKRPGLELIIRQRLMGSNADIDLAFLKDAENLLSETKTTSVKTSSLDRQVIIDTLQALSDKNNITDKTREIISEITPLEVTVLSGLVKTLKVLIKKLVHNLSVIDYARAQINWIPIPSINGPEDGPLGASLSRSGVKSSNSELDNTITELRVKKLNAEREVNSLQDLGEFASPFSNNMNFENTKKYSDNLDDLVGKRDKIAHDAFVAMGEIEQIVGEVSGLGLIDVIAIYIALWSLDLTTLLNFLDVNSFNRLYYYNVNFRGISEVDKKYNGANLDIITVLENFEHRLKNILSFADKIFAEELNSPLDQSGGQIV